MNNNETNQAGHAIEEPKPKAGKPAAETILVVEDEPDLLELVAQVLQARGYTVLGAGTARQALELWTERKGSIDLLLTDMTIPDGMTGSQLAQRLRKDSPNLRVIYTSGHTVGIPGTHMAHIEERQFLAKPYRPSTLLEFVRNCLDGPVSPGPGVGNN
jgi:DNA-binding NtrC family response regulator